MWLTHRRYLLATFFSVLVPAAFAIDLPTASLCRGDRLPGDVRKLIELAEVFAHGVGVACILLTVIVLDRRRRRSLPRMVACAFGAGLLANLVKLSVIRMRPRDIEFGSVWETFRGWFPLVTSESLEKAFDSDFQSFPSAHTATAVGLAIVLGAFYPRGRWLFVFFAALAAIQRIETNAHFPSDVFAGAAVGCLAAAISFDGRVLGKWFDRIESPSTDAKQL